ncbi:synaptic vesicle 2-related protein isoform X2 [Belonocnema kinseyi]|nr:synaptic vesicle 2-related protein isoform X2 [Belonocnema kinseyi]
MANYHERKNQSAPYQELEEFHGPDLNISSRNSITRYNDCDNRIDRSMELNPTVIVPDDTFTVGQAINSLGFGGFQVKLSLVTGLCWMADSMEITILSILSPTLHCDWSITRYEQAVTTTVVFLGMVLSSTFWNNLSDRYGRKKTLTLCGVLLFYYGFLSSFAPNFMWILLLRGLVGFAIGCVPQSVTLYAEFLPAEQRAKCVVLLDCFWALGACFGVVLALILMPSLGWRWLLGISTIPLLLFSLFTPWLPESVTFDLLSGRTDRALNTLERVAQENNKPMPVGRLVLDRMQPSSKSRWGELLSREMCKTTILLWIIWMASAFCYYGIVLITTELLNSSSEQCNSQILKSESDAKCQGNCKLTRGDYIDILWTTLAEFPGIFSTIFLIEKLGKKLTMVIQLLLFALVVCLLSKACILSRFVLTIGLFLTRGLIAGVFQAAYVYTPEMYPNYLRDTGVSTCTAMARFGAMITPYVALIVLQSSSLTAMGIYAITAISAAVAIILLPVQGRTC